MAGLGGRQVDDRKKTVAPQHVPHVAVVEPGFPVLFGGALRDEDSAAVNLAGCCHWRCRGTRRVRLRSRRVGEQRAGVAQEGAGVVRVGVATALVGVARLGVGRRRHRRGRSRPPLARIGVGG